MHIELGTQGSAQPPAQGSRAIAEIDLAPGHVLTFDARCWYWCGDDDVEFGVAAVLRFV